MAAGAALSEPGVSLIVHGMMGRTCNEIPPVAERRVAPREEDPSSLWARGFLFGMAKECADAQRKTFVRVR